MFMRGNPRVTHDPVLAPVQKRSAAPLLNAEVLKSYERANGGRERAHF